MTEMEYNQAEGIRRSDLWRMDDSPEKFKYFLENPVEQTPAMAFGSACHKFILEPLDWGNEYAVAPQVDKRTKDGRAAWEQFLADNQGKTVVNSDDYSVMEEMSRALTACPLANRMMFTEQQAEVPLFWTDPETGEKCKAKLDILRQEDGKYMIVDYKTAMYADTFRFNAEIWKRGYYFQAGFYSEGLKHSLGLDYMPRFMFVAQEKKAPYAVNVIEVSEEVMNAGVAKFHELLEKYHECRLMDMYPGYVGDVPNDSYVPGWAADEIDEEF